MSIYIYIYVYIHIYACVCLFLNCIRAGSREVSAAEQPCKLLQRPEAHGLYIGMLPN